MLNTILTLAGTILGLFLALGAFFLMQSYFRWKAGCGKDKDLLDYMADGCASCKGPGECARKLTKEHHHEPV